MVGLSLLVVVVLIGILWLTYREEKRSRKYPSLQVEELWRWEERRGEKRTPKITSVFYRSSNGKRQQSKSQDLSGGGVQVVLPEKLTVGTELELEFSLAQEQEPFRVMGQVVWMLEVPFEGDRRLFRTGFRFIRMEEKEAQRLRQFLYQKRDS